MYRGVDSRYPIGAWAASTGSSVTLSFPGLTLWAQDNTSWIAGFGAHRTATNVGTNAPSGMAVQSSAVDIAVFDTNGTVSSWSTQTASVNANSGWCTFSIEIRTAPGVATPPSPDNLVQSVCGSNLGGGQSPSVIKVMLPNKTKAGNCIAVAACCWSSLTPSVADDKGNTYGAAAATGTDATNGFMAKIWVAPNVAADTQVITLTFNDSAVGCEAVQAFEFYNIATSSPVDANAGAGPQVPAGISTGAMTTTQANDLILQVAFSVSQFTSGNQPLLKRITADPSNGLVLCGADVLDGVMAQYGIKATAGAINPTFNTNSTGTAANDFYVTAAVALKTASAGSPGSGKRIVRVQGCNLFRNNGTTSIPLQFPSSGNLLAITWLGFNHTAGAVRDLTAVSDTASNTWAATGAAVSNTAGKSRIYYAGNAAANPNLALTLTVDATQEQSEAILYDMGGMDPSPFDQHATASGTQSIAGDLTTVTITPTNSDGIVLCKGGVNIHSCAFPVGAGFYGDAHYYPEEDGSKNYYEDNPAGHFFNSNTSPVQFVFSTLNNTAGVDTWVATAAAFKAASAGANLVGQACL